tara:strand:+ start:3464 stop:4696 length:1233 start_codon:yes stop_codon:yes gene_type:complete
MSQLDPAKNEASADQLYFDITVSNFKSTTTKPPQFYFNEQRTLPFVRNPEDYYLSILRFTMETGSLPVFIPSIEPNQGDRNKTIYSFTLEYTDPVSGTTYTSGQTFINFIPQRSANSAILPPAPNATANGLQNNQTGYYNIYNYGWLIDLMNITLETAFTALKADIAAGGGTPIANDIFAPFFNWDTTSNTAVLYADFSVFGTNGSAGANPYKIYLNAPLFGLFPTFPCKYLGYANVLAGKNFLFEPRNNGSSDLDTITPEPATVPATYRAVKVYQDCSTIANFSPITAVVFTSNTLPIQANQVSTPLIFNNSQEVVLGGNNSDFANIITDLVSDTGQYKPNIVYNPTSEYRLITLYGNRPLFNIDLNIFWRNKFGQLIPFEINSGECVTMKVAFLKKSAYIGKGQNPQV